MELSLHLEQRRSNATDLALQWLLQPARHKEFCIRKVPCPLHLRLALALAGQPAWTLLLHA